MGLMVKTGTKLIPAHPAHPAHPARPAPSRPSCPSRLPPICPLAPQLSSGALLLPTLFAQNVEGAFVGAVPSATRAASSAPVRTLLGAGLGARLSTDLSLLGQSAAECKRRTPRPSSPDRSVLRPHRRAVGARPADPWVIRPAVCRVAGDLGLRQPNGMHAPSGGFSSNARETPTRQLRADEHRRLGGRPARRRRRQPAAVGLVIRVLVSGVDDEARRRGHRCPGSWIFSRDDLQRALLALRMNGAPLSRDHGVPGSAGRARLVRLRVHQAGRPHRARYLTRRRRRRRCGVRGADASGSRQASLARDFIPAVIDTAAMPIRVEKWSIGGRLAYRVTGIIWGGSKPTNALSIRFRSGQPWVARRGLPAARIDADVEPVVAHVAA